MFNAVPGLGSCSTRNIASILSKSQDTYVYLFAHPTQETIPLPGDGKGAVTVGHATEIPYVFGDVWAFPNYKDESDLAFEMGTYWINFAKYGSPNSVQTLPKWPKYDSGVDAGLGSCSTRNIASILSKSQDTYVYLFAHPTQETIPLPGDGKGAVTVGHATEIPYVFGDVWAFAFSLASTISFSFCICNSIFSFFEDIKLSCLCLAAVLTCKMDGLRGANSSPSMAKGTSMVNSVTVLMGPKDVCGKLFNSDTTALRVMTASSLPFAPVYKW